MIGLDAHVELVASWMRGIRAADGYATDAGATVVTERVNTSDANSLVLAVYLDDLTPTNTTATRRDWQFDIKAEARVPVKQTNAEATARAVLEDMAKAVPGHACNKPLNLQTLALAVAAIERQPEGIAYIVVGVTLRGTCFEYLSPA